jgi:hypothetical protein
MTRSPWLLLSCWLAGCAAPLTGGSFQETGFQHDQLPFTIAYADASRQLLIDDDWQVESHRISHGRLAGPKGGEHSREDEVRLDFDADSEADRTVSVAHHDLEITRKSKRGEVTIFTELLRSEDYGKHLSVLTRDVLDRVTGTHVQLERTAQGVKLSSTELSTVVRAQQPIRVGARDGYAALVDIHVGRNDPDPVRMAFVIVPAAKPVPLRSNLGEHAFAAVHVFTMTSDGRDFQDSMRGFERLLAGVSFQPSKR